MNESGRGTLALGDVSDTLPELSKVLFSVGRGSIRAAGVGTLAPYCSGKRRYVATLLKSN